MKSMHIADFLEQPFLHSQIKDRNLNREKSAIYMTVKSAICERCRPHIINLLLSYGNPHQYVFGCIVETPLLAPAFSAALP